MFGLWQCATSLVFRRGNILSGVFFGVRGSWLGSFRFGLQAIKCFYNDYQSEFFTLRLHTFQLVVIQEEAQRQQHHIAGVAHCS